MKVALIFPVQWPYSNDKPMPNYGLIAMGISYISSVLKLNGHSTRLFVLTPRNANKIEASLDDFNPQLVCLTAVATTYHLIKNFATQYKKKHPQIYLIAGGCHVSLNPEMAIEDSFDAICIGEGEYPVLELAAQMEHGQNPSNIQNLWIKNGSNIQKNPTRPFLEYLDEIPFPDREMWREWTRYPNRNPAILIGRGCPFKCTYCCNHKLAQLAEGKYYRFRSPQNIVDELRSITEDCPEASHIYFETETIGTNLTFVLEFCSMLESINRERERALTFSINLRVTPNMHLAPLFEALHRANFTHVNIGLESGSERVRRQILNRIYSNDDIINAVTLAKQHGFKVMIYIMIGLPGETLEDFEQTVKLARECQADSYQLNIFYPYPGTILAHISEEEGMVDKSIDMNKLRERGQMVLNLPGFSKKQVMRSFIWFEYNIYKGKKPFHTIMMNVLWRKLNTSSFLKMLPDSIMDSSAVVTFKDKLMNLDTK
jgi:radical SAM superfamily enzyme YgiQ (UPF0313 family)